MAENFERLTNTAKVNFLDIKPEEKDPTWALLGRGVTSKENSYGAKVTDEHWITEVNERHSLDGYALGSDIEQTALKGDEVFDFVDELMYRMKKGSECETQKLEVFKYRVNTQGETPVYDARLFKVLVVPDTDNIEGGSAMKIKYKLQTQGDPVFGKVTFTDGKPIFVAE